jgi:hypothetical protein
MTLLPEVDAIENRPDRLANPKPAQTIQASSILVSPGQE